MFSVFAIRSVLLFIFRLYSDEALFDALAEEGDDAEGLFGVAFHSDADVAGDGPPAAAVEGASSAASSSVGAPSPAPAPPVGDEPGDHTPPARGTSTKLVLGTQGVIRHYPSDNTVEVPCSRHGNDAG